MKFPLPSSPLRLSDRGPSVFAILLDFRPSATGSRINSKLSDKKKTDYLLYVSNKDIGDIKSNGKIFKRFHFSRRFFLLFSFLFFGGEGGGGEGSRLILIRILKKFTSF